MFTLCDLINQMLCISWVSGKLAYGSLFSFSFLSSTARLYFPLPIRIYGIFAIVTSCQSFGVYFGTGYIMDIGTRLDWMYGLTKHYNFAGAAQPSLAWHNLAPYQYQVNSFSFTVPKTVILMEVVGGRSVTVANRSCLIQDTCFFLSRSPHMVQLCALGCVVQEVLSLCVMVPVFVCFLLWISWVPRHFRWIFTMSHSGNMSQARGSSAASAAAGTSYQAL